MKLQLVQSLKYTRKDNTINETKKIADLPIHADIIFGFLVIIDSNKAQKENKKNKKGLIDSLNNED